MRPAIARLWLMYYKGATPCMFPQFTSHDVIADHVLSSWTVQSSVPLDVYRMCLHVYVLIYRI
jgi:hypothetical protein